MELMGGPCRPAVVTAQAVLSLAIVWFAFGAIGRAGSEPIFLGIIERNPAHYSGETGPTPFMVRAAFVRKENAWKAFPSTASSLEALNRDIAQFPERVAWTIAFDGQSRGQFHTKRPPEWKSYADIGLLQPDPLERVNLISSSPGDFAYWTSPWSHRPLVVVSQPNFSDPGHWKQAGAPPEVVLRLIPLFRKQVKSAPLSCDGKAIAGYSDRLIRGRKSYVSAGGSRLVQLALNDSAVRDCPEDEAYASRWFFVEGNTIRFVGQSLELIDAGDYDNDGHSEVVFHKSGYNFDGYILLYDQLTKTAEFSWHYQ